MKSLKVAVWVVVCLALMVALPASAMTTTQELDSVLGRCSKALEAYVNNGYVVEHIELDWLKLGEVYSIPYKFYAGYEYKILGIGGVGIRDLDVHVYDENKNLVATDTLDDDVPEADVAPKWDGPFYIQLSAEALDEGASAAEDWYFCFIIGSRKL